MPEADPLLALVVFALSPLPPGYVLAFLWDSVRGMRSGEPLRVIPTFLAVALLPAAVAVPAGSSCGVARSLAAFGGPLPPIIGDVLAIAAAAVHWSVVAGMLMGPAFRAESVTAVAVWGAAAFSGVFSALGTWLAVLLVAAFLLLSPLIAAWAVSLTAALWLFALSYAVRLYTLADPVLLAGVASVVLSIVLGVVVRASEALDWLAPYVRLLGTAGVGLLLAGLSMRFLDSLVDTVVGALGCPGWRGSI